MARKMITAGRSPAFGLFKDGETDWAFRRTLEFMGEKLDSRSRGAQVLFDWLDEVFECQSATERVGAVEPHESRLGVGPSVGDVAADEHRRGEGQ